MMQPLYVTIADVPFTIEIEDTALRGRVRGMFGTYLAADVKPFFKVILDGAYRPERNSSRRNDPVMVEKRAGKYFVVEGRRDASRRALGTIDVRRKTCRFVLDGSFNFFLITSAIRSCFLFFLERHGGFFLHAASGIVNGYAYTFTGKSDSGKTTALGNFHPDEVLAEDALAVRLRAGNPEIFAIPFRGEKNARAPAKAVFFPRKSKGAPRMERESAAGCASELLANAMFSSPYDTTIIQPVLETIGRFCRDVPGFNLYFPKAGSLREVIA